MTTDSTTADRIRAIRGQRMDSHQRQHAIADAVLAHLRAQGRFLKTAEGSVLFVRELARVIPIIAKGQELRTILLDLGISPAERGTFAHVLAVLQSEADRCATLTRLHDTSYYDHERATLYLFNQGRVVFKITAAGVTSNENGVDDVYFTTKLDSTPFELLDPGDAPPFTEIMFRSFLFDQTAFSEGDQKELLRIWFYAIYFRELHPTRPLLFVIAPQGSGKTDILRRFAMLLHGKGLDVMPDMDKRRDFDTAVTNLAYVALDNVERSPPWLPDRLANVATGGMVTRRSLYTNNTLVTLPITAFLAMTSINPPVRRADVADRLIPIRLKRLPVHVDERKLQADLLSERNLILSVMVRDFQRIIATGLPTRWPWKGRLRMADFERFAVSVATAEEWIERLPPILDRLAQQQGAFGEDEDPIIKLILIWLTEDSGRNLGREVLLRDLALELGTLARRAVLPFPCLRKRDPAKSLAAYIRSLRPALERLYVISEREERARERWISFSRLPDQECEYQPNNWQATKVGADDIPGAGQEQPGSASSVSGGSAKSWAEDREEGRTNGESFPRVEVIANDSPVTDADRPEAELSKGTEVTVSAEGSAVVTSEDASLRSIGEVPSKGDGSFAKDAKCVGAETPGHGSMRSPDRELEDCRQDQEFMHLWFGKFYGDVWDTRADRLAAWRVWRGIPADMRSEVVHQLGEYPVNSRREAPAKRLMMATNICVHQRGEQEQFQAWLKELEGTFGCRDEKTDPAM